MRRTNLGHALPVTDGLFEFACVAIAILVFLGIILLWPFGHDIRHPGFVVEVMRQYAWADSRDQRWGYLITLLLVAAMSAVAFALSKGRLLQPGPVPSPKIEMTATIVAICIILIAYGRVVPRELLLTTAFLVAVMIALVMAAGWLRRGVVDVVVAVLLVGYLALLIVPGFLVEPIPLLSSEPDALSQFEMHLISMTMPGSEIASGQNIFGEITYVYGVLWPSVMSVIDQSVGQLSIGDQLRFVQVCQLLFCVLAIAAYFTYQPRGVAAVLFVVLLAGPFWPTAGLGIWHPNQTGYRSLGLPLCFLILALMGRCKPRVASWWLGAVAALAMLVSFDSGAVVSIGCFVYLMLRTRSWMVAAALRMAAGGIAVLALYLASYRFALGRLPFTFDLANPLLLVGRLTSDGFGGRLFVAGSEGENYFLVPLAIAMVAHAIFVVIRAFIRLGGSPLPHRPAFRAGVSTSLLVWFSYYFNAPNWWQIWTLFFIYGFLLLDLFDLRLMGIGVRHVRAMSVWRRLFSSRARLPRIAVLLLVALAIPFNNSLLVQLARDFVEPPWTQTPHETAVVSGVAMPRPLADALETKARALANAEKAAKGDLLYLTYNEAFMPMLTGLFEPFPYDVLWAANGEQGFQAAMAHILARRYSTVLIDAPSGPLAVSGEREKYQDRWRATLAQGYRKIETRDGWEFWQLEPPNSSPERPVGG